MADMPEEKALTMEGGNLHQGDLVAQIFLEARACLGVETHLFLRVEVTESAAGLCRRVDKYHLPGVLHLGKLHKLIFCNS